MAAIRRALADCPSSIPWLSAMEIRERLEAYGTCFNGSTDQQVRYALNSRIGPRSDFISKKQDGPGSGRVHYALRKNVSGEHWIVNCTALLFHRPMCFSLTVGSVRLQLKCSVATNMTWPYSEDRFVMFGSRRSVRNDSWWTSNNRIRKIASKGAFWCPGFAAR